MQEEHEIFVPGRLCLMGEHSDWAGFYRKQNPAISYGMAVVCVTNEGLFTKCRSIDQPQLIYTYYSDREKRERTFASPLSYDLLVSDARSNGFFSYVTGTAAVMVRDMLSRSSTVGIGIATGIHIHNYKTTLPMKKGLSSSAAICVTVAKCFNAVYSLGMDLYAIMDCAYRGERETASRCGRLDQSCAMGAGQIGLMEFDGDKCDLRTLHCAAPLYFVVADMKKGKDTVVILKSLNDCFPFPATEVQNRCHSYVAENQAIVWGAIAAIGEGNVAALAAQLNAAQRSFDNGAMPNCPSQLTSPRLHAIINNESLRKCAIAVKGVGSQGDGTVQVLCANPQDQAAALRILETELGCEGFLLTVPASTSASTSPSAALPALIHRHRPRTAVVVVASAESVSPASLSDVFEELLACAIESICLVAPQAAIDACRNAYGAKPNGRSSGSSWTYEACRKEKISTRLCYFSPSEGSVAHRLCGVVARHERDEDALLVCRAENFPLTFLHEFFQASIDARTKVAGCSATISMYKAAADAEVPPMSLQIEVKGVAGVGEVFVGLPAQHRQRQRANGIADKDVHLFSGLLLSSAVQVKALAQAAAAAEVAAVAASGDTHHHFVESMIYSLLSANATCSRDGSSSRVIVGVEGPFVHQKTNKLEIADKK